ncbi:MAG: alpha/beta hydrolase [Deltaproteobacteria bacterium]|nr:alpha/beta hydrolase [Deltaproteobacteria bacterium]
MKEIPLLIFLHGIGARGCSFQPLIDQFEDLKTTFEFVVVYFWGFTGTPIPETIKNVSMKAFSEQVVQELAKHNPNKTRPVHIIGHSMGGAVTVEIHRLFPEVKIDSFINLEGVLQSKDCGTTKQVSEQSRESFCKTEWEALKKEISDLARNGDIAAQDWILGLEKTTAEVFYDASVDLVRVSDYLYPVYCDWDIPTVYIFGEKTLAISRATHDRLLKDGKNVVVLPNAGHVMQVEQPQATANICRKHLMKCMKRGIS